MIVGGGRGEGANDGSTLKTVARKTLRGVPVIAISLSFRVLASLRLRAEDARAVCAVYPSATSEPLPGFPEV